MSSRIGNGQGESDFSFYPFSEILFVCYSHLYTLTSVNFSLLPFLRPASMMDVKWPLRGAGSLSQGPVETGGHLQTRVQSFVVYHLLTGMGSSSRGCENLPAPTGSPSIFSLSDWGGFVAGRDGGQPQKTREDPLRHPYLLEGLLLFHRSQVRAGLALKRWAGP